MNRLNLFVLFSVCPMMVFGQLKVQSNGNTFIGGFLGTSTNVPLVFKVNNTFLAGSTGCSGNMNVSFGYQALSSPLLTGANNTANGYYALRYNTTGSNNTATGYSALAADTTGSYNTANGSSALRYNTTGYNNTANGYAALCLNSTGNNSTAVGVYALYNNTTGIRNTAVGYQAGATNNNDWYNTTAIGYNAQNTVSNQVSLGNTSVTSFLVGGVNITIPSDGRAKKNIRTEVPGLAFINLLQPITYNMDLDALYEIMKPDDPEINRLTDSLRLARSPEEIAIEAKARANKEKQVYSGFIAQDVEKAAQSVGYDFSGVDAPENDKGTYGLRYADFVVPLVKAVQELSEQNNRLQEQINELTARLDELTHAPKSQNAGVINESEAATNFSFSLFPNPTSGFVTVDYTLHIDAPIGIELYNSFGQRVKLIVPQQNQKAGTYSVQISVGDLGTGTYIVKASSGNQVESKQLVVNH